MRFQLSCFILTTALGLVPPATAEESSPSVVTGRVCDVFRDDVDPLYAYLMLVRDGRVSYVASRREEGQDDIARFERLIGCTVALEGRMEPFTHITFRRKLRALFMRQSFDDVTVLSRPTGDGFAVPELDPDALRLEDLGRYDPRRVRGVVLARWRGDSILIQTERNGAVTVQLRNRDLPALGATVDVVGTVTTDLYRFKLLRAHWRPADGPVRVSIPDKPVATSLGLLFRTEGRRIINSSYHGKSILIRGTVKGILSGPTDGAQVLIDEEGERMTVDMSGLPETSGRLREGCEVEIRGVCVQDTANWMPNTVFPKVSGLILVPGTAEDIRVLRDPPWWTPFRFACIVFLLLSALVAILIWNATLRALVARKSRALLVEQTEKLSESLKVEERTRLAAELHDSHSQILTAIAYRISSARRACLNDPAEAARQLTTAASMLKSCRTDLRNCLWDLKSDVLNESDFAEAIRRTVLPVAGAADLSIRFTGRRAQLSDSTAHTVLNILRELTANAVNHGRAAAVRIAGECRDRTLGFSVEDDGAGFDPAKRPGSDEGHFGLCGIAERLTRLGGGIEIESAPGKGACIRFTISNSHQSPQLPPKTP